MGEDKTKSAEVSRHRHSSVLSSSCSEDAESESTSAGYPEDPDERDEELEYGPGIVHKLRTRFLSITLKQNRGTHMRRSCSMENLLEQDRSSSRQAEKTSCETKSPNGQPWGNLKRAKSMDTLLMEMIPTRQEADDKKPHKIIKRVDGGLTRPVPCICDEELPKPDTVKTYKRMFEPAESRRGSYCRRPPVLRASAKSCAAAKMNGFSSSNTSAKLNGSTSLKSKISAKQLSIAQKDHIVSPSSTNLRKPLLSGEPSRPLYNGCHVARLMPVKVNSNNRNCKETVKNNCTDTEKNMNSINRVMNKKEIQLSPKSDIICNGIEDKNETLQVNTTEEIVKRFSKNICTNGCTFTNMKPKVPPNRPVLKNSRPFTKVDDKNLNNLRVPAPKLRPTPPNKIQDDLNKKSDTPKSTEANNNVIKENISNGDLNIKKLVLSEIQPKETCPKSQPEPSETTDTLPSKIIKKVNNIDVKLKPEPDEKRLTPSTPEPAAKLSETVPAIPRVSSPIVNKLDESPILESKIVTTPPSSTPDKQSSKNSVIENKTKPSSSPETPTKPVKKSNGPSPTTSMVFDFRGKDVVPHVAVVPTPFGCKSMNLKKRTILVDGREVLGEDVNEDDEDFVDYSVPPPCGLIFEGENIKIGRGSILSKRNKDLKITFDDDVDGNTFVYPSESSLLDDPDRSFSPNGNEIITNGQSPSKLKSNTTVGSSTGGGLSAYTPSVLRTVDNFEPGMFRPPPEKEPERDVEEEEENNLLKPADPHLISSWSISAGTSDLLF